MSPADTVRLHAMIAPVRLVAETRSDFRREALEHVERRAAAGAGTYAIDLGDTVELDGSGLGVMVLLQKRAAELGMATALVNVRETVRHRLAVTKLDSLFQITD